MLACRPVQGGQGDQASQPQTFTHRIEGQAVFLEFPPEQLAQARTILEQRVNGQGVSGAEVVTNGNTLVITVPGEDTAQAQAVGQTSKLLFRPVMAQPMPDTTKISKVAGDMANRWVKYGVLTADEANERLTQLS